MKEITSLDDGFVNGWKEDIDTLLVFAGLFSAVVTAFTVESYQWLEEAPEDVAVVLLRQISQQMNNTAVPSPPPFQVSSSVIRINILWFLSLIIALVDALFALLCKQWLREHRRHTRTRTPEEALALRWLRSQSLKKWHIQTILGALPMLLELALFLFLAGILELLRARHRVPFIVAIGVVLPAGLFYLGTTILPTIDIIRQALKVSPKLREMRTGFRSYPPIDIITILPPMDYICPYKSPQAWAAFQLFRYLSTLPGIIPALFFLFRRRYIPVQPRHDQADGVKGSKWVFNEIMGSLSSWSFVDLEVIQRSKVQLAPPFHELNAFRWLVSELRDSPNMVPHLQRVLATIPLHLAMPAVLDQWFFLPEREWHTDDIRVALEPGLSSRGIKDHKSPEKQRFLDQRRDTELFNQLLHYIHVVMNVTDVDTDIYWRLPGTLQDVWGRFLQYEFEDIGYPLPFHKVNKLLKDIRTSEVGIQFTNVLMKLGQSSSTDREFWAPSVCDLARYIITSSPDYVLHLTTATTTSPFIGSAAGARFLTQMHHAILESKVFQHKSMKDDVNWMEAMDIVRRVHQLPADHFQPLPGYFPLRLSKLEEALNCHSPGDSESESDLGYLSAFRNHWGNASLFYREKLVEILSHHIKNHQPKHASEALTHPHDYSPLVSSSAGLELLTVVHTRLASERETYSHLLIRNRIAWRDALQCVRKARPDLPPDQFKLVLHDGIYSPDNLPLVKSGGPTTNSGDDTGRKDPANETDDPFSGHPSLELRQADRVPPANDIEISAVGVGEMMGGADADEKV
ncbi:hypothetical protein PQX77_010344 [Marasmius sp. AFHP31]|nr:hypothetical protein PQX77_010344 [Marasmius sp. AFHP31]